MTRWAAGRPEISDHLFNVLKHDGRILNDLTYKIRQAAPQLITVFRSRIATCWARWHWAKNVVLNMTSVCGCTSGTELNVIPGRLLDEIQPFYCASGISVSFEVGVQLTMSPPDEESHAAALDVRNQSRLLPDDRDRDKSCKLWGPFWGAAWLSINQEGCLASVCVRWEASNFDAGPIGTV